MTPFSFLLTNRRTKVPAGVSTPINRRRTQKCPAYSRPFIGELQTLRLLPRTRAKAAQKLRDVGADSKTHQPGNIFHSSLAKVTYNIATPFQR